MGDPSSLRLVPASESAIPIDWTRVPEATKKFLTEQYGYSYDTGKLEHKPLPATIGDLAKMFDETKFFGYFRSSLLTVLMDISEFGLQLTPITQVGPRFYMKYTEQVWFLLFAPGTRECIMGYSDDITNVYEEDEDEDEDAQWEKWAAEETAMAQAFDVRLKREVSRGMGILPVMFTGKLGGWTAMTLESQLEYSQYVEAVKTLPRSHPAYQSLMEDVFRSFKKSGDVPALEIRKPNLYNYYASCVYNV